MTNQKAFDTDNLAPLLPSIEEESSEKIRASSEVQTSFTPRPMGRNYKQSNIKLVGGFNMDMREKQVKDFDRVKRELFMQEFGPLKEQRFEEGKERMPSDII